MVFITVGKRDHEVRSSLEENVRITNPPYRDTLSLGSSLFLLEDEIYTQQTIESGGVFFRVRIIQKFFSKLSIIKTTMLWEKTKGPSEDQGSLPLTLFRAGTWPSSLERKLCYHASARKRPHRHSLVRSISLSADVEDAKGDAENDSLDFSRASGTLSLHNSRRAESSLSCLPSPAEEDNKSANAEAQCAGVSEDNTRLSTTSQGYVLPEGKIMPNTVFVGGIDIRMNEAEIRSFFERYGTVKEVKIITDRTGVSKGYGFVSFLDNVDVQKIVESQINFHGKRLKLGPAIRKQQNLCSYVHPRPLVFNPPAPQFHSVWGNQNTETYMQPPAVMSPVTQYVQTYPYSSPALLIQQQVPVGYQPAYNYQVQPQWLAGEQRNYVMPPVYTSVSYHCTEDPEFIQTECAVPEPTQSSTNSPQKKSVDRSIQTVVSCLFNPENRLRNTFVSQEDYFKERKAHHFRKGRAVLKSV
ncbi:deleted in azoospermia-like [Columba livia]|uniref:Deleted in azoospermia-like n=1 Tax=Columba livia TaxID=8932 RepID=A0A2I0MQP1_COLLI|nr:deleted in azoospermia-like [Columba livia]